MEKLDPFPPADPLAEALQFLRMNGAFYCRSELSAPWGLTLPLMPGYIWFHVVTSGRVWLETDDAEAGRCSRAISRWYPTAKGTACGATRELRHRESSTWSASSSATATRSCATVEAARPRA